MFKKHKILAVLAIVLFAFTSCKKDDVDPQIGINQKTIDYLASGYWHDSSTNAVYQYDANEDKRGGTIKMVVIKDSKISTESAGSFSVSDKQNFKFDNEWRVTESTESKITLSKVVDGQTTEETAVFTKVDDDKVIEQVVKSYMPNSWKADQESFVWEFSLSELKMFELQADGTLKPLNTPQVQVNGLKISVTEGTLEIINLSKTKMKIMLGSEKLNFSIYQK